MFSQKMILLAVLCLASTQAFAARSNGRSASNYTPSYAPSHSTYTPSYTPSRPSYTPSYTPSRPSYTPSYTPSRPSYTPSRPAYTPSRPAYTPSRPSTPSYTPGRPGYSAPRVQRTYNQTTVIRGGVTLNQRTYNRGNISYVRNYSTYSYRGREFNRYAPAYHYNRLYYGYLYAPWFTPVVYGWGWANDPWYGYYGYYYRPYPTYAGPAYWLTDYVIADLLAEQYAANSAAVVADAASNADAPTTPITDDVKEQIKTQVEAEVKAHDDQAPVALDSILSDTKHIFAVSADLDVTTADGAACALTDGDLIRLANAVGADDQTATMAVVTSKKGSCAAGSLVTISLTDLQNFQNEFSARVEKGMAKMKTEAPAGAIPGGDAPADPTVPTEAPAPGPNQF